MKEIPILFRTPMVQAILDGRKTMTRRVNSLKSVISHEFKGFITFQGHNHAVFVKDNIQTIVKCPYGQPGDILWVRESWNMGTKEELSPDDQWMQRNDGLPKGEWVWVYKAGIKFDFHTQHPEWGKKKWKPSIHMPKEACRIWLEVTDVRVERLQEISEADAKAEGSEKGILRDGPNTEKGEFHLEHNIHAWYQTGFKFIWMNINGRESWNANPWVWVVSFKVLSTTGRLEFLPSLIASPGEGAVVVEEKGCRTCRRGEFLPVPGICDICFASSFWEPKSLPESNPKEPSRGIVAEDSTDALMEQLQKSEIN